MRSFGRLLVLGAVTLTVASCASSPPPIPVGGTSAGVRALAGTWDGDYSSQATGRYGSIHFTLAANADTAYGDVLMVPRRSDVRAPSVTEGGTATAPPPAPQPLKIAFVLASGDSVAGVLEPYEDPACACMVLTRFAGRLRGSRIEGRYSTRNSQTGGETSGQWSVRRK